MSKVTAPVTGTLRITTPGQALSIQGTLVEQTAEYVTLDVKRRGSKKTDRTTYAATEIRNAFISEEVNETYLTIMGELVEDYPVTLEAIQAGFFSGTMDSSAVLAAPGTWIFLPDVAEGEEEATPPKKTTAKAADKAPAKTKAKAEPEPEPESDEEEEQEEYVPAEGDYVKVVDNDDQEETLGTVDAINTKTITVGGTKFKLADVTVTQEETPAADDAPAADDEQEEEEQEEYAPADGDYVAITEDEEVTKGTVTALTSKKITIEDGEGEEHAFLLKNVTVEAAKKPAGKGKAADKAADKPAAKASTKPAAKDKSAAADDW